MNVHIAALSHVAYDTTYWIVICITTTVIAIHTAKIVMEIYLSRIHADARQDLSEYYGHHILIDRRNHFEGVYLADSKKFMDIPVTQRTLVLDCG